VGDSIKVGGGVRVWEKIRPGGGWVLWVVFWCWFVLVLGL